jgi:hypothetical protein
MFPFGKDSNRRVTPRGSKGVTIPSSSMRPPSVKLLFRLRHRLFLQSSIELVASLNVRPLFASNELLSVLASFCQTPHALFAQRRFGKRWEPEGGTIPNCILEFT